MKLTSDFQREIIKLGHDREFRLRALKCSRELPTPENMNGNYSECIRKYGRATVAVCTAATIIPSVLSPSSKEWSKAVCDVWRGDIQGLAFNDGLNVTRIMDYSRWLQECTVA